MSLSTRPVREASAWPVLDSRRWTTLVDSTASGVRDDAPVTRRRVLVPIVAGACVVLVLVALSGVVAARRLAEKESVTDAAQRAGVLADAVVQPALRDGLASGDRHAYAVLDRAVRAHVLGDLSIRVKVWTPSGRIVYSDEPALVGRTFPLGAEERGVFQHPETRAEVSDLSRPENRYERGKGRLLEVYRPVWTPRGDPLLFETYTRYTGVSARTSQLWRGFGGITLSSLLALIVLMMPMLWRLTTRVRLAQQQREALLEHAVEASTDERRRIAGNLHDGVIQDLAGASLVVSSAAANAASAGQPALADQLRAASTTVRRGITAMRSLVVDIYPPNLETAGLAAALDDLVSGLRARDVEVRVELDPEAEARLQLVHQQLVYRVVHETLLNAVRHADPHQVSVGLTTRGTAVVLEVTDDGRGFDVEEVRASPEPGHFGLQVLTDLARDSGSDLAVASVPGRGTRWLLRLPDGLLVRSRGYGAGLVAARGHEPSH